MKYSLDIFTDIRLIKEGIVPKVASGGLTIEVSRIGKAYIYIVLPYFDF